MAIRGLDLARVWNFESALDPDKGTPEATTFLLGALDSRAHMFINDSTQTVGLAPDGQTLVTRANMNAQWTLMAAFGIKGWTNLRDAKGNVVEYATTKTRVGGVEYTVVDPEVLKVIPLIHIQEIGLELRDASELSPAKAKNSET